MRTSKIVVSLCVLSLAAATLLADDYLKDGKLTQPLTVLQLQGGFAGNTGVEYQIAPDGAWTAVIVFNQKKTPKNKGTLNAKQLEALAGLLAKYDLAKLPAKSGKLPGANPHTIAIQFGKQKATLVGQTPPKLDANNPTGTIDSRFAGIYQGVTRMLNAKGK